MIILKHFNNDNLELLLRGVALSCLTTLSDENKESIYAKVKSRNKDEYYFIVNNNEIIGTIYLNNSNKCLSINDFAIFEEYQNKGYGQEVLKYVIDKFKNFKIELGVEKRNEKALYIYKKLGFKVFNEFQNGYKLFRNE